MFGALSRGDTVFDEHYRYSTADRAEPSFVTKEFDIEGRTSNLEVTVNTNLINNWAYFNLALINEATGDAFDFGREVSYYAGSDSDGAWSEGGQSSTADDPAGGRRPLLFARRTGDGGFGDAFFRGRETDSDSYAHADPALRVRQFFQVAPDAGDR